MRKIPVTMATQHPDNACIPYWGANAFIDTKDEVNECFKMFSDLGCHEYMWDFEGKFVDESVIMRLFRNHFEYFKKTRLGKDVFLTFRIPNIWIEPEYRILKAFISILSSNSFAKELNFYSPPIFEVIHPMTKSVEQLMHIRHLFRKTAEFEHQNFGKEKMILKNIEVIPLIEGVVDIFDSDVLLEQYLSELKKDGEKMNYLRTFIARSDPAINSGLLSAVIAVKVALFKYQKLENKTGVKIFPWLGAGSLPFRGGINPENIEEAVKEYAGLSSVTVQSAFRYDYPLKDVKKCIKYLNDNLPKQRKKSFKVYRF
jgi:phosphoenolpyruvate carboxylase